MSKRHRAAFAADPKFQARIAGLIRTPSQDVDSSISACPTNKKPGKSAAVKRAEKVREANRDGRGDSVVVCEEAGALTFVFAGAMLLALNVSLRMHDAKASGLKETWYERVRAVTLENRQLINAWKDRACFPLIVEEVYVTGESSLMDSEAVAAGCKPVIDAIVRSGVIPDDSLKFIAQPIPYTERGTSPSLVISFRPSPKPWGHIEDRTVDLARNASLATGKA